MNRVNFKNINTKSIDQSYFKPKVNVKVKKEIEEKSVEVKTKYQKFSHEQLDNYWYLKDRVIGEGLYQQIRQRAKYTPYDIPEEMKPNSKLTKKDVEDILNETFYDEGKLGTIYRDKYEVEPGEFSKIDNIVDRNIIESKIEKPKEKIIKTFIDNENRKYNDRGYHGWHGHCKYELNNSTIKLSDNVGGCGVQQLYGWGDYKNTSEIPKLLDYILNDLHYGVSMIMCQIGSDYYDTLFCKTIEKLGFKYHEEYINYQHGGRDTGRIYTLIINKNDKNKRITEEE